MLQNVSTALILAANFGHIHAVRLLLNNGADIDYINKVRESKYVCHNATY